MTYYKVKPDYDNYDKAVFTKSGKIKFDGFLVGNELYTEKEFEKIATSVCKFDIVHVSKNKTYWFFGARFSTETGGPVYYDEEGNMIF